MGLNIAAASHLRYVGPMPSDEEWDRLEAELEQQGKALFETYFPVEPNLSDYAAHLAGLQPGLYARTPETQVHDFRVGPYSYYNGWRRHLCRFALGVPQEEVWVLPYRFQGQPFVELINFTDCDGRIGTTVAAKLAQDFRSHFARAEAFAHTLTTMEDWMLIYVDFLTAFELAAQDGALAFC